MSCILNNKFRNSFSNSEFEPKNGNDVEDIRGPDDMVFDIIIKNVINYGHTRLAF